VFFGFSYEFKTRQYNSHEIKFSKISSLDDAAKLTFNLLWFLFDSIKVYVRSGWGDDLLKKQHFCRWDITGIPSP
jgi:hypothetical protein